jgi:hypothetical protein
MPKDFSRDLGYLDKFLQGLRDHAASLGDPAATRLSTLLDQQDRAWAEIRGLLSGGAASGTPQTAQSDLATKTEAPFVEPTGATNEAMAKRLTVGSLMS